MKSEARDALIEVELGGGGGVAGQTSWPQPAPETADSRVGPYHLLAVRSQASHMRDMGV